MMETSLMYNLSSPAVIDKLFELKQQLDRSFNYFFQSSNNIFLDAVITNISLYPTRFAINPHHESERGVAHSFMI